MKDLTEYISCTSTSLEPIAATLTPLLGLLAISGELHLTYRISAHRAAANVTETDSILVDCNGPDALLLLEGDGEVLRAAEWLATKMLWLEKEERKTVSFRVNAC